jgi:hypothetical protein
LSLGRLRFLGLGRRDPYRHLFRHGIQAVSRARWSRSKVATYPQHSPLSEIRTVPESQVAKPQVIGPPLAAPHIQAEDQLTHGRFDLGKRQTAMFASLLMVFYCSLGRGGTVTPLLLNRTTTKISCSELVFVSPWYTRGPG